MKTVYSLDFSKCYYFDNHNTWIYKEYAKIVGLNTFWYTNPRTKQINLIQNGLCIGIVHLDGKFQIYEEPDRPRSCTEIEFWNAYHKVKYNADFDELVNE